MPDTWQIKLKDAGSYLFWCRQPALVAVNHGEAVLSKYNAAARLLSIKAKSPGTICLSPLVN